MTHYSDMTIGRLLVELAAVKAELLKRDMTPLSHKAQRDIELTLSTPPAPPERKAMRHCKAAELEPCNWPSCDCVEDLSGLPDEAGEMVRKLREIVPYLASFGNHAAAKHVREAASLIERLSPRWISVGKRLPETTEDVLCMWGEEGEEADSQAVGYYANSKWTLHCGLTTGYVTHWQTLPLPPQKGST